MSPREQPSAAARVKAAMLLVVEGRLAEFA